MTYFNTTEILIQYQKWAAMQLRAPLVETKAEAESRKLAAAQAKAKPPVSPANDDSDN